jgi:hypothetical protein
LGKRQKWHIRSGPVQLQDKFSGRRLPGDYFPAHLRGGTTYVVPFPEPPLCRRDELH